MPKHESRYYIITEEMSEDAADEVAATATEGDTVVIQRPTQYLEISTRARVQIAASVGQMWIHRPHEVGWRGIMFQPVPGSWANGGPVTSTPCAAEGGA